MSYLEIYRFVRIVSRIDNRLIPSNISVELLKRYITICKMKYGSLDEYKLLEVLTLAYMSKHNTFIKSILENTTVPKFYVVIQAIPDIDFFKLKKPNGFWEDHNNVLIVIKALVNMENKPFKLIKSRRILDYLHTIPY